MDRLDLGLTFQAAARMNGFTRRHIHVSLRTLAARMRRHVRCRHLQIGLARGGRAHRLVLMAVYTASERGQVKLARATARASGEFNLLSDRRDLERLMGAFRKLGKLYMTPAMEAVTSDPFPASYTDRVRKIGVVNTKNKVLTQIAGAMLDGPSALRSYLINKVITEGFSFDQVMADDEALEAFVRKSTIGVWHASCSCRMGADGDSMAVTDPEGRVRGVDGLRVVDASIFPLVPCANTNFPTLMTAEKIADAIVR
jgi:5-(hydroxymethyl)furfural/furfural oxidase